MKWGTERTFLEQSTLKIDAACSSDVLVTLYRTIQYHTLDDNNLNFHCHGNLKSHISRSFITVENEIPTIEHLLNSMNYVKPLKSSQPTTL
jgi:hypothetical protein